MPYLTTLAAAARRTGYPVVEVSGWKSRGHGPQPAVLGIVAHHTAGWNDMHVVRDGRSGLPGPLSQIWLKRDGTIYVVAAGRCWHNAPSLSNHHTNSNSIGIEAENDGRAPWPARQLDSYKRLCAELCREYNLSASRVKGHREVNSGKPDPHSINMNDFRADIARLISAGPGAPTASEEDPLIGLREGSKGEGVKAVQRLIVQAGRGDMLGKSGVDGDWGPATSKALLATRKDVGSKVDKADSMTGEAYAQLLVAMARDQAKRYGGGE
ncbi:peptidoglycan recognition family protein [Nocardiopsis dassonvillei]|uniref:peptidoglycan recognition protein family protein n=1 Tax=Nocardiopsis dassonvillei TaxID=2014 RepID=UPI00340F87A7